MPKIKIEIEVPKDCGDCKYFHFHSEVCNLFDEDVFFDDDEEVYERCWECKQAEVEDENQN